MNRIALSLALAVALAGCAADEKNPSAPKTTIATATAGDLTVELLTDTRLETGKTPIYVKVMTATGQLVTDATVTFVPMMEMTGGMSHSAPMIGVPTLDGDGLFACDVVFQMASGTAGSWNATVSVTRPGSSAVEAIFPSLMVADSGCGKTFSYTDPVTSVVTKYVVSLDFDAAPRVGLNPVVVTLHRRQDMMTFVPVDDAAFVLDPQMPSMGHGSPGSVSPTLVSPGVYEGQLSFSMAGDWETTVTTVNGAGVTIGTSKFAITF
jgi:YtkA-like protein